MDISAWGWPQFVYVIITVMGFGWKIAVHGQPPKPHDVVSSSLATAITCGILWAGGFFG